MNKELNQKLNYLLLGDDKYTECPHIVTFTTDENGIIITEDCGTNKVARVSFADIVSGILDSEEGKKMVSDIITLKVFKNR